MNNGKKELYANLSSWCLLNFKLYICLFAVNFVEPELVLNPQTKTLTG